MPLYTYEPLPSACDYIRILTIEPAAFHDDILVSLGVQEFDRDNPPVYEALSYVWGSEETPESIQVGLQGDKPPEGFSPRGTLSVTQNLDCALRHLRLPDARRVVWVDAICIDQLNSREKGAQVAIMGDIFRRASGVIAWLGPEEGLSSNAMRLLESAGGLGENDIWKRQWILRTETSVVNGKPVGEETSLCFSENDLSAIFALLRQPYFHRLWIRQEIYLPDPQKVTLVCGNTRVGWPTFRSGLGAVYTFGLINRGDSLLHGWSAELGFLRSFAFQHPFPLIQRLRGDFEHTVCKDARDRIYAILALLPTGHRQGLSVQPDYSRTVNEVFRDVVVRYIRWHRDVEVLAECQISHGFSPSWVPDWSQQSFTRLDMRPPFTASSRLAAYYEVPNSRVLSLAGVLVAKITRVHDAALGFDHAGVPTHETMEFLRAMLLRVALDGEYAGGGSILDAYATTLACGRFGELFEPAKAEEASFAEFKDCVDQVAKAEPGMLHSLKFAKTHSRVFRTIQAYAYGRRLFEACGGSIGMAPSSAREGDDVCVFLGARSPMVLRRTGKPGEFRVVGHCYMHGASMGEALLGPLPEGIQAINFLDNQGGYYAFRDNQSGRISAEDPRLSSLPIDLTEYRAELARDPVARIDVEPDLLRQHGVDVRYLDLV